MNLTTAPPQIWSDSLLVGHAGIDNEHTLLAEMIARMQRATEDGMVVALDELLAHTSSHFSAENALMLTSGFPPRDCHIKEHDAVLSTMTGVRKRLNAGEFVVARRLADALAEWFPAHVQHLDSALSHWLCKLQFDAKPMVLRMSRKPAAALAHFNL
ncbi:hemerythrin domain-containing protein [Variovorax sp. J31P179]|uniref:bacteriohemerythrin n=1 Tax=Variovorax sp. J31P179 TaxID=3053508 RepID=UPI002578C7B3|nr:hemerythrin domain-containing protein [Variovorax sp. J31P179]MDM0084599.1 hemerythrin domain-containing protein [Variovorax sp. J31P179]